MFVSCKLCAVGKRKVCDHDDDEKCLTEVWMSVELQKAIKKGYVVKEVYEIYHYKMQCLLYKGFVKFFKIKKESSGYPL